MSESFYYEHIGHMHIDVITLELYKSIFALSSKDNELIQVSQIFDMLRNKGFSSKVINSEIERFFYGFMCIEKYIGSSRILTITQNGLNYINEITKSIFLQKNQFAFIVRNSRKKGYVNVTIQESTFFSLKTYEIIREYDFRDGGTRDFVKCIKLDLLNQFLGKILLSLDIYNDAPVASITECIEQVKSYGKFWNSIVYKYSWLFFKQKYELLFNEKDWQNYKKIIETAKYPVEWGGKAKDLTEKELFSFDTEIEIDKFVNSGIIRKLYDENYHPYSYRLTVPGFVMWQRKERGFLLEVLITRLDNESYVTEICDASDKINYYLYNNQNVEYGKCLRNYYSTMDFLNDVIYSYKNRGDFMPVLIDTTNF